MKLILNQLMATHFIFHSKLEIKFVQKLPFTEQNSKNFRAFIAIQLHIPTFYIGIMQFNAQKSPFMV